MLGSLAYLPFAAQSASGVPTLLLTLFAAASAAHFLFARLELSTEHPTENAKQAAALLTRIPVQKGSKLMAFPVGLLCSNLAAALVLLAGFLGFLNPALAGLAAGLCLCGLFLYEQAFVRAAQIPPLS
jgi:hypothetical protein